MKTYCIMKEMKEMKTNLLRAQRRHLGQREVGEQRKRHVGVLGDHAFTNGANQRARSLKGERRVVQPRHGLQQQREERPELLGRRQARVGALRRAPLGERSEDAGRRVVRHLRARVDKRDGAVGARV